MTSEVGLPAHSRKNWYATAERSVSIVSDVFNLCMLRKVIGNLNSDVFISCYLLEFDVIDGIAERFCRVRAMQ